MGECTFDTLQKCKSFHGPKVGPGPLTIYAQSTSSDWRWSPCLSKITCAWNAFGERWGDGKAYSLRSQVRKNCPGFSCLIGQILWGLKRDIRSKREEKGIWLICIFMVSYIFWNKMMGPLCLEKHWSYPVSWMVTYFSWITWDFRFG